ncbi:MAG: hypothetical protein ABSD75_05820 [Terriglobales bacterium]|jgi:hypothetical protein
MGRVAASGSAKSVSRLSEFQTNDQMLQWIEEVLEGKEGKEGESTAAAGKGTRSPPLQLQFIKSIEPFIQIRASHREEEMGADQHIV